MCNCVPLTLFPLRVIFGPLHHGIAIIEAYIINCYVSWELLIVAEIFFLKALTISKFYWVSRIDEKFVGKFFMKSNLGYVWISQTVR